MNSTSRRIRFGLALALSILALGSTPASALIVCPLFNAPSFGPAHPSADDEVAIYTLDFIYILPGLGAPGTTFLSRVDTLQDNTIAVSVVITTNPDAFPEYNLMPLPLDGPSARVGPLPVGTYKVVSFLRSGQDPAHMTDVCSAPKTVVLQVTTAAVATVTEPVIEFYHAASDHYFMTQDVGEIADLDSGVHSGWVRTGGVFLAYKAGQSDRRGVAVARYYGLPSAGLDTHFFSATHTENFFFASSKYYYRSWQGESGNVFEVASPDFSTGSCPNSTEPVYRLWNGRADGNHRYATNRAARDDLLGKGWLAEGYGPLGVVMCAPRAATPD